MVRIMWLFMRSFLLSCEFSINRQVTLLELVLSSIWSRLGPVKVVVFSWQLLQDSIPTRENLPNRGISIVSKDISCPFYPRFLELSSHLFMPWVVVVYVWYIIFEMVGVVNSLIQGSFHPFSYVYPSLWYVWA